MVLLVEILPQNADVTTVHLFTLMRAMRLHKRIKGFIFVIKGHKRFNKRYKIFHVNLDLALLLRLPLCSLPELEIGVHRRLGGMRK